MTRRPRSTLRGRAALEEIDRRLGGLLDALQTALGDADSTAEEPWERAGETTRGGLRAEWAVRIGAASSAPRDAGEERSDQDAEVGAVEPVHALRPGSDGYRLTVELPDADPETLTIRAYGAHIDIATEGARRYALSVPLPEDAEGTSRRTRLADGVLEILIPRRGADSAMEEVS